MASLDDALALAEKKVAHAKENPDGAIYRPNAQYHDIKRVLLYKGMRPADAELTAALITQDDLNKDKILMRGEDNTLDFNPAYDWKSLAKLASEVNYKKSSTGQLEGELGDIFKGQATIKREY